MPRLRLRKALVAIVTIAILSIAFFHLAINNAGVRNEEEAADLFHPAHHHQLALSADDLNNINLANRRSSYRDDVSFFDDHFLSSYQKLWFMKNGKERPEPAAIDPVTSRRTAKLWPEEAIDEDRIVDQLMFVPPNKLEPDSKDVKLKKILLFGGLSAWTPVKLGQETFLNDKCPVNTCEVTGDRNEISKAHAVLFNDHTFHLSADDLSNRPPWQVWILYLLECPLHTHSFFHKDVFNWTATYRRDSDIVTPYEKYVAYDKSKRIRLSPMRNYAANKTKKVAWFVSNCGAQNGRNAYAAQLGKHIQVDIYGGCGKMRCPRNDQGKCFQLLNTDYKFYLSFENSNCKDYITEKFFVNGLGNDVVPIVLGASKEAYRRVAPPYSYIHVEDFESPKQLAEYLYLLDNNDTLYNEYFRWKETGEFINTYFWCRLCAVLHDDFPTKHYSDVNDWWRGKNCINGRWDNSDSLV